MTFRKSTRYALYAAIEMARSGPAGQVTVTRVAELYSIPTAVLAKVFQQLVRTGVAESRRGVRGGYALARPASELTVLDVIEAFEPPRAAEHRLAADDGAGPWAEHGACRLRRLFDEVDEMARCTYASVTLETLAGTRSRQELSLRVVP